MTGNESVRWSEQGSNGSERTEVIRSYKQKLTGSGSGSGVALHFDAEIANTLKMDADTELEVSVVDEDGDVKVILNEIPAGFTRETFEEFARKHGWEQTDSMELGDEWSLTYRDQTGEIRIEVDSTTHIDGDIVNNIFIEGPEIVVDDDLDAYRRLCVKAIQKDLRVRVRDSEGLWQRLKSSTAHKTDDAPDEETFQQLITVADRVTVQLTAELATLTTSLEDIEQSVAAIAATVGDVSERSQ